MRQTVSVSSLTPSVVIVREAYERFSSAQEKPVDMFEKGAWFLMLEPRATFVTDVEEWLEFQCLVAEWRTQRGIMSSISEAAMCSAYQRIIGMGQIAVPFMLRALQSEGDEPDQWFWALKAITRDDPIADVDRGDFVAMARSWLRWGKEKGYVW